MKIEDQLNTLQQGKRLQELGVTAAPLFWHVLNIDPITDYHIIQKWQHSNFDGCMKFPAYSVAELGVMLPDYKPSLGNLEIGKAGTDHITPTKAVQKYWYNVSYWDWDVIANKRGGAHLEKRNNRLQQAQYLAQALAYMLIHLLETNQVTAADVNARLV